MTTRFFHVDAFSDEPFRGNPAGVCLLEAPREAAWMQALAAELRLSETAFLLPGEGAYGLRWFTPEVEVELCGHATLASAKVLFAEGLLAPGEDARFDTLSGRLLARQRGEAIELELPARREREAVAPAGLLEALGARPRYVGRTRDDYLLLLASEAEVRALCPDPRALRAVAARGVIVTAAASGAEHDFVSRFFAPAVGVDEDPVTGSAHACLAPFWAARLGRRELRAYQASARGGALSLRLEGERGESERVVLGGGAVIVHAGELRV